MAINDSTSFSPRIEKWGSSAIPFGSVIYLGQGLPSASDLTSDVGTFSNYNISLNFDISLDSGGRYNDVRNFYTQTSQSEYFTLTLKTTLTSPRTSVAVYIDKDPAVELVSNSNCFDVGQTLLDSLLYDTILAADSEWVLDGSTYNLVIQFDWNQRFGSKPEFTLNSVFKNATWNGRLNIYLGVSASGGFAITHPVPDDPTASGARFDDITYGQWVPSWSGWSGRSGYVGRPILDMKTGLPTFAEAVVEDEYHEGIWTVPAQWDEIDPRDVRQVEFPENEGTRKDDVPA